MQIRRSTVHSRRLSLKAEPTLLFIPTEIFYCMIFFLTVDGDEMRTLIRTPSIGTLPL
jgi:hypothetical protein